MGKSELAKTLASYYFGSEEAMVRLDMSEFMERHTVSKLIGSPPGMFHFLISCLHSCLLQLLCAHPCPGTEVLAAIVEAMAESD